MNNRFFIGTLILLVLLSCGTLFKSDSQAQLTPTKFKVAFRVQCLDNIARQSLVEGAIKRELRTFEDVQIVGNSIKDALWDYLIYVDLYKIPDYGMYAYYTSFYNKIPIRRFNSIWQETYKKVPAVGLPFSFIGTVGVNDVGNLAEVTAADFGRLLQAIREDREMRRR